MLRGWKGAGFSTQQRRVLTHVGTLALRVQAEQPGPRYRRTHCGRASWSPLGRTTAATKAREFPGREQRADPSGRSPERPRPPTGRGREDRPPGCGGPGRTATRAPRSRRGDRSAARSLTRARWRATCHWTTRSARTRPPAGIVEEAPEDRGRVPERRVRDDPVRIERQRNVAGVGVQHRDVRRAFEPIAASRPPASDRSRPPAPPPPAPRARP